MAWQVVLVKAPVPFLYQTNYFPRSFHYKKDAERLKREVEQKGGLAVLRKT